jgi:hypothetical protein
MSLKEEFTYAEAFEIYCALGEVIRLRKTQEEEMRDRLIPGGTEIAEIMRKAIKEVEALRERFAWSAR